MNMHKISDFLLKILIPVAFFAAISVFTIHLNKAYAQDSVTQSTDTKNSTEPNACHTAMPAAKN